MDEQTMERLNETLADLSDALENLQDQTAAFTEYTLTDDSVSGEAESYDQIQELLNSTPVDSDGLVFGSSQPLSPISGQSQSLFQDTCASCHRPMDSSGSTFISAIDVTPNQNSPAYRDHLQLVYFDGSNNSSGLVNSSQYQNVSNNSSYQSALNVMPPRGVGSPIQPRNTSQIRQDACSICSRMSTSSPPMANSRNSAGHVSQQGSLRNNSARSGPNTSTVLPWNVSQLADGTFSSLTRNNESSFFNTTGPTQPAGLPWDTSRLGDGSYGSLRNNTIDISTGSGPNAAVGLGWNTPLLGDGSFESLRNDLAANLSAHSEANGSSPEAENEQQQASVKLMNAARDVASALSDLLKITNAALSPSANRQNEPEQLEEKVENFTSDSLQPLPKPDEPPKIMNCEELERMFEKDARDLAYSGEDLEDRKRRKERLEQIIDFYLDPRNWDFDEPSPYDSTLATGRLPSQDRRPSSGPELEPQEREAFNWLQQRRDEFGRYEENLRKI